MNQIFQIIEKNHFAPFFFCDKLFLNINIYLLFFNNFLLFLPYNFNFKKHVKKKQLRI
jgi:hypothetical protein